MVDAFEQEQRDPERRAKAVRDLADWEARNFHQDTGNKGEARGFARADAPPAGWEKMNVPGTWEDAGLVIDGAVWFRREIELPPDWAGQDLALSLGAIDDFDVTYWNGTRVGATGAETPQYWEAPRHYVVPGRLARAGRNVIAVRVFDHYGSGGFAGPADVMTVRRAAGDGAGTAPATRCRSPEAGAIASNGASSPSSPTSTSARGCPAPTTPTAPRCCGTG